MEKSKIDATQSLYLDACLTGFRDRFYAAPVPKIPNFDISLVHLEMLNIWGHFW